MTADGDASLVYTWSNPALDTTTYSVGANGTAITNLFDESDPNKSSDAPGSVTWMSRSDWTGTIPTAPAQLTANETLAAALAFTQYDGSLADSVEMPTLGAKNGLALASMIGKDFDDPEWNTLLDQLTYDEMVNTITLGFHNTAAAASIGKTATKDENGPQGLTAALTGGASGALGGAVGTGLSRMNAGDSSLRGNVERYAAQDEYEQALKEHQRREELAREPEPLSQRVGADSPPNSGALGMSVESDGTEKGSADLKAAGPAAEGNSAETAAISDNLAVQTFAEAAAGDSLTGKTIRLFNPEAGNEANRAAFEEAYGVKLPSTAAATWRMLREVAAQRSQQNAVENAGESVESSTETAADGAEPLSQRISADSPPSMGAIGRTGNVELTAQNGADRQAVMQSVPVEESTLDGMDSSNSPMRETYGMEAPKTENGQKAEPRFHFWIVDTLNALM